MIKILSIGNSFSEDAQRYLYGIARADGVAVKAVNLYIGGCSLSRHFRNMLSEERAYEFQINGMRNTGIKVSLKEALLSDDWDFVTLQQASHESFDYETYQPYLYSLEGYVEDHCPKAKILIHNTWGYKKGSARLEKTGYSTHMDMYEDVKEAYKCAAEDIEAYDVIPSGDAVFLANEALSGDVIYHDDIHMSRGFGRYLLGLVWYGKITGNSIEDNGYNDFDVPISDDLISVAKEIAADVLGQ